jgi:hypothetical protein
MSDLPIRATITPLSGTIVPVELHGLTGWVPSLQPVLDRWRRLGASGGSVQSTGKESPVTTLEGWRAEETYVAADISIERIEALQGKVVTIKDAWTRIIKRARVMAATARPARGRGMTISGAKVTGVLVYVSLSVERLTDD